MPSASELRELDDNELDGRLVEYRRELLNLRFQLGTGQLDNVTRVSEVRRDIARVLTVLRDREIAVAEGRDAGPVFATRPLRRPRAEREESEEDPERTPRPARSRRRTAAGATEGDEVEAVGTDKVSEADAVPADNQAADDVVGDEEES